MAAAVLDLIANAERFDPTLKRSQGVIDQTTAKMERLQAEAKKPMGGSGGGEGGIKGLKSAFGEESGLGLGMKALMGAGAIGALGLAARMMGDIGEKAGKIAEQLRSGAIAAEDLPVELVKSLPVLGDIQRAALGVWEAISSSGKVEAESIEKLQTTVRLLSDEAELSGVTDEKERSKLAAKAEYAAKQKQINDAAAAASKVEGTDLGQILKLQERGLAFAQKIYEQRLAAAEEGTGRDEKAVQSYTQALEAQLRALTMTKSEIVAYDLAKKGATEAEIEAAQALQASVEAETKAKAEAEKAKAEEASRTSSIDATIAALKEQADTYGMTAEQIAAYRLQQKGATDEQLAEARAAAQRVTQSKEYEATQERIKQIHEQSLTPAEKYAAAMKELDDLRSKGLAQEDYERAAAEAQKQLASTKNGTAGPAFEDVGAAFSRIASAAATHGVDDARTTAEGVTQLVSLGREQIELIRSQTTVTVGSLDQVAAQTAKLAPGGLAR